MASSRRLLFLAALCSLFPEESWSQASSGVPLPSEGPRKTLSLHQQAVQRAHASLTDLSETLSQQDAILQTAWKEHLVCSARSQALQQTYTEEIRPLQQELELARQEFEEAFRSKASDEKLLPLQKALDAATQARSQASSADYSRKIRSLSQEKIEIEERIRPQLQGRSSQWNRFRLLESTYRNQSQALLKSQREIRRIDAGRIQSTSPELPTFVKKVRLGPLRRAPIYSASWTFPRDKAIQVLLDHLEKQEDLLFHTSTQVTDWLHIALSECPDLPSSIEHPSPKEAYLSEEALAHLWDGSQHASWVMGELLCAGTPNIRSHRHPAEALTLPWPRLPAVHQRNRVSSADLVRISHESPEKLQLNPFLPSIPSLANEHWLRQRHQASVQEWSSLRRRAIENIPQEWVPSVSFHVSLAHWRAMRALWFSHQHAALTTLQALDSLLYAPQPWYLRPRLVRETDEAPRFSRVYELELEFSSQMQVTDVRLGSLRVDTMEVERRIWRGRLPLTKKPESLELRITATSSRGDPLDSPLTQPYLVSGKQWGDWEPIVDTFHSLRWNNDRVTRSTLLLLDQPSATTLVQERFSSEFLVRQEGLTLAWQDPQGRIVRRRVRAEGLTAFLPDPAQVTALSSSGLRQAALLEMIHSRGNEQRLLLFSPNPSQAWGETLERLQTLSPIVVQP